MMFLSKKEQSMNIIHAGLALLATLAFYAMTHAAPAAIAMALLLQAASRRYLLSLVLGWSLTGALAVVFGLSVMAEAVMAVAAAIGLFLFFSGRLMATPAEAPSTTVFMCRHAARVRLGMAAVLLLLALWMALVRDAPLMRLAAWFMLFLLFFAHTPKPFPQIPCRQQWKKPAATIALLLFQLFLLLALLEGGARFLFGAPSMQGFVPHPRRMFTLKPGSMHVVRLQHGPADRDYTPIPCRISPQGIRDREYGPKAPDEFRIVLIGDSFAFGYGLAEEEMISRVLEEALNTLDYPRKITVINCGVIGYGPWHERDFLEEIGFTFQPDLVLHQLLLANDIRDSLIVENKHLPAFNRRGASEQLFYLHAPGWLVGIHRRLFGYSALYLKACSITPFTQTAIPFAVFNALSRLRPFNQWTVPEIPPVRVTDRFAPLEVNLREWYPELEEGWRMFCQDVLDTQRACKERGVDYIALAIPLAQSVLALAHKAAGHTLEEDPRYDMEKDTRIFEEFCEKNGIPYIHLLSFYLAEQDPQNLFFPIDAHLTPYGVQRTVARIADYLTEHYFPEQFGMAVAEETTVHTP